MIEKHYSLEAADKVVECLRPLFPTEKIILECFENGREQGYYVYSDRPHPSPAAAFAQQKNGDAIVIYTGTTADFVAAGNQPSNDRTWQTMVEAPTPTDAARIIADHLLRAK